MTGPVISLRGVTKAYGAVVANDNVDLDVYPGRVHAIVGENGAGKTTLMSMINGTGVPDAGDVIVNGRPVLIKTPQKAQSLGIGMVFQHVRLVGSLSVAANVFLGRELTKGGLLDFGGMAARVADLSSAFGLDVDPVALARDLSVGEAQRVEVLKALSHDTSVLILDEPTAVLTPSETDDLFVAIRNLAKTGVAVVFISHKLDEVIKVADDLTVMRAGRAIATVPAATQTTASIARMMVGRDVLLRVDRGVAQPGDVVLEACGLTVRGPRGAVVLDGLSVEVRSGEIVGIAGVDGNGQSELVAVLAGLARPDAGTVMMLGEDVTHASVRHRRERGMAYIPEDRQLVGTAPGMTVAENLIATHLSGSARDPLLTRGGWVVDARVDEFAGALMDEFGIRGATPSTPVAALSGGNMQKVVIARELAAGPAVFVVSQPTRGVDVGAMEFVHRSLISARDRGAGVLLVSADLSEVMSLADRLLVIHRGAIVTQFDGGNLNETAIGLAMAGVEPDEDTLAGAEAEHAAKQESALADAPVSTGSADDVGGVPTGSPAQHTPRPGILTGAPTHALQSILVVVAALLIGLMVVIAIGANPADAYYELFVSSFTTAPGVGGMIGQLVPLLVLSSGVIVSFRAGFFNCGGEGQLYAGSLAGAVAGVSLGATGLPAPVVTVAVLVAGLVAGGVWGGIPGGLYAGWRVNIVVTTLMMNSVATLLTAYLVTGPFRDPATGTLETKPVPPGVRLPMFAARYSFGLDVVIALAVVAIMGLVLTKSVWGMRVRELGEDNGFARYTGVSVASMSVQVMSVAGAVSGLAGALVVLGPVQSGRFLQQFSPGYGFLAMTVALLARLNPWTAIVAAVFYAAMMAGGNAMQINAGVPFSLVSVIQGLLILMLTGTFAFNWVRARGVRRREATA